MNIIKILTALFCYSIAYSQVGIGTTLPDPSSALHIESNTQGVLFPRLTMVQMNDIVTRAINNAKVVPGGLTVYCTDCCSNGTGGAMFYYNGADWISMDSDCAIVGKFPCVSITTTHLEENHFKSTSIPYLFDGHLTEATQSNNIPDIKDLRLHHDDKDIVEFKLDNAIPVGGQIILYWSDAELVGSLGIIVDLDNSGTTSQATINTLSNTLPNSTNTANGANDFILTINIISETDTITIKSFDDNDGKDPYLMEMNILDDESTNIISPCN